MSMHCTEIVKTNTELDGKEVIELWTKNWTTMSKLHDGEESTKQESEDKVKSKTIAR